MYKPISTYTGRHFDPYHAVAADLDVRDIAHAQSLMTRANGHFPAFYSVGQHSLACAREALVRGEANQTALFCLLHDGAEAYMSDVTRPVKARLPEFVRAEERLLALLFDTLADGHGDRQRHAVGGIFAFYRRGDPHECPAPAMHPGLDAAAL